MAKSLRSKVKKRMRAARGKHLWEVRGKQQLERIVSKLNDPNYDHKKDLCLPPNAFVDPSNPEAVFPQHSKPDIIDFRSNNIAEGAGTVVGAFRQNRRKSKYATIVKLPEQLEAEEREAQFEREQAAKQIDVDSSEQEEEEPMGVDELANLASKMTIDKKRKKAKEGKPVPQI